MDLAFHYVCTRDEAKKLMGRYDRFWVSDCGCREKKGKCERSRIDVCLYFRDDIDYFGTNFHEVTKEEVEKILQEAEDKHLVTRPFRDEYDKNKTDGICFCCDDCCEYFLDPSQKCDKGNFIEKTDKDKCANCGTCVDVCYFKARKMAEDKLVINRRGCYGCGLCVDVCSQGCIKMVYKK